MLANSIHEFTTVVFEVTERTFKALGFDKAFTFKGTVDDLFPLYKDIKGNARLELKAIEDYCKEFQIYHVDIVTCVMLDLDKLKEEFKEVDKALDDCERSSNYQELKTKWLELDILLHD